jgi:hypothetical protein
MMKIFRNRDVPALYVKYEDIKNKEVIGDVCKFILNKKSIDDTVIAKRLESMECTENTLEWSGDYMA